MTIQKIEHEGRRIWVFVDVGEPEGNALQAPWKAEHVGFGGVAAARNRRLAGNRRSGWPNAGRGRVAAAAPSARAVMDESQPADRRSLFSLEVEFRDEAGRTPRKVRVTCAARVGRLTLGAREISFRGVHGNL
ncbi:MAG: hypothetical protein ABR583_14585 [Gaiellaceae bacterium]